MDSTSKPKIMIGVPGFAGMQPEVQENFFAFAFRCGRDMPEYDFLLRIITKKEQFRARNSLVNMAIGNDCDYLLMLDDDMLIPPDLLSRLMAHDKDVVGALYWQRGGAYHPVMMDLVPKSDGGLSMNFLSPFDTKIVQKGLHRIDVIGGGCMLFKVPVFRKITPPYFWWEAEEGTDIGICRRLGETGVEVWVDTSIELGHLGDKQIITSRTIPKFNAAVGTMKESLFEDMQEYLGMSKQELEGEVRKAGEQLQRSNRWNDADRSSWDNVKEFYQDYSTWHILNLGFWAAVRTDQQKQFALTELDRLVPQGGNVLDYGPGIGLTTIELAKQGYHVTAVEVAKAPTLEFIRWRAQKHGLQDQIDYLELDAPFPEKPLGRRLDGALIISVLDHLWAPYEALEWVKSHLVPGAPVICDWESIKHDEEPQHIIKYDPYTFQRWMAARGMKCSPERSWLFINE